MGLFDSHAHYYDEQFEVDGDELLKSMPKSGVDYIVTCPSTPEQSRESLRIAERYPYVYAAVGIHPQDCGPYDISALEDIRKLSKHPKCVAIGEIGLDYYYENASREKQKNWFREQCILANEVDKPVIVHDRDSHADTLAVLKDTKPRGVVHCFSGSIEMADELLKMGFYISFTGVITFKNAKKAVEVVAHMPLDRLMIETDSPYLAPEPLRGTRNDSRNVRLVAQKIAEIRGISFEEVADCTTENAKRLFGIR
ncbi:MAG: TatD family hydrolase [Bacillota bacterium]|nr:TatD family hydrolase [Bacillota bacterium]